jgi:hypothetical protein
MINSITDREFKSLELVYKAMCDEMVTLRAAAFRILVLCATLGVAALAFIISRDKTISKPQLVLIISALFMTSSFVTALVIHVRNYFMQVATVIKRIENIMGCHTGGKYSLNDNETLMPEAWVNFGGRKWREPFFSFSILLIWILFLGTSSAYILSAYSIKDLSALAHFF